jgi:hypothetical protein
MFEKVPVTKHYATINLWCFRICIAAVVAGFAMTLLMIWDVFDSEQVIEKAWLSLALFFGTSVMIALLNNAFSLRVARTQEGEK